MTTETSIKSPSLKYLSAYSPELTGQIQTMIDEDRLKKFLLSKYPEPHNMASDKALRDYVMGLKQRYMKKSGPLSNIQYDQKIHVVSNALGLHRYATRVQGGKLKTKNSICISAIFKTAPEAFLSMIVVHELAHLKEKDHNKNFYQLCLHMLPEYHQLEFDTRVYLTQLELSGDIYSEQ
ncbi:MAG: putative metal-dependent hydrolase [Oleiphilaceae bacterium]|jgi:predicted metal-dependent hydrolase